MKYNTLNEINGKLNYHIKSPIFDRFYVLKRFFKYLDIGFEGFIQMSLTADEPWIPMMKVESMIMSVLEQQYYPLESIQITNDLSELVMLQDMIEVFGVNDIEKLIYQYLVVNIPKYIIQNQMQQQRQMFEMNMLQHFPEHMCNEN